eukprot:scaffold244126_cov30-Tisochrysis_lutea.AAC.3
MSSISADHRAASRADSSPLAKDDASISAQVGPAPAPSRAVSASCALASAWRCERAGHRMRSAVAMAISGATSSTHLRSIATSAASPADSSVPWPNGGPGGNVSVRGCA